MRSILIKVPKKYRVTEDDKEEIKILYKRILKFVLLLCALKLVRVHLRENGETHDWLSDVLYEAPLEQIFQFTALTLISLGVTGTIILYLIQGTKMLRNKIFSFVFFFSLLDMIFLYNYPEITASVFRAIFIVNGVE